MSENTSDDIYKSTNMPATHVTDVRSPGSEIDTNSANISQSDQKAPSDLGVPSISNYELPKENLPQSPGSYCSTCGYRLPLTPSSSASSLSSEAAPSRQHAHLPELAGRGDQSHDFSDFRSPSLARRRDKSAKEKYYGFRYVKRGDVHPESAVEERRCCCPESIETEEAEEAEEAKEEGKGQQDGDDDDGDDDYNGSDAPPGCTLCDTDGTKAPPHPNATTGTKQDQPPCKHTLYKMAQVYPRPPKNHHRHVDKMIAPLRPRVDERREQRKHRKAILKDGLKDLD
jgi:hypothetical protein